MPTVIIVDNSLSMGRLVGKKEKDYRPQTPKSPQETITIDGKTVHLSPFLHLKF